MTFFFVSYQSSASNIFIIKHDTSQILSTQFSLTSAKLLGRSNSATVAISAYFVTAITETRPSTTAGFMQITL